MYDAAWDISQKTDFNINHIETVLREFVGVVMRRLSKDGEVTIYGFGKFYISQYPSARNRGLDGQWRQAPAAKTLRFRAARKIKDQLNGKNNGTR